MGNPTPQHTSATNRSPGRTLDPGGVHRIAEIVAECGPPRLFGTDRVGSRFWVSPFSPRPVPALAMTLGRWMIAVAVVGVLLAFVITPAYYAKARAKYRRLAQLHAARERSFRWSMRFSTLTAEVNGKDGRSKYEIAAMVMAFDRHIVPTTFIGDYSFWSPAQRHRRAAAARRSAERDAAFVAYHAELRAKYERAVARPWEPVANDPPPPNVGVATTLARAGSSAGTISTAPAAVNRGPRSGPYK